MPEIFSSVVANLATDLKLWFPPDFDFYTMLNKVAQDAGVCIQFDSGTASCCRLQGLWCSMEQAYSLLAAALAIHGIRKSVKDKDMAPASLTLAIHGIRKSVKDKDMAPASLPSDMTSHQCASPLSKQKSAKVKQRKKSIASSMHADTQDYDEGMMRFAEERLGDVSRDSAMDRQVTEDCGAVIHLVNLKDQEQQTTQLGSKHKQCNSDTRLYDSNQEVKSQKNHQVTSEVKSQKNHKVTLEVKSQKNHQVTSEVKSQKNHQVTSEVKSQKNHQVTPKEDNPFPSAGKQQKRGRFGTTHSSQVNHKYSFLSKYGDHSYPSLRRTVRKRRAVFPLETGLSEPVVKRKQGRPKRLNEQGDTLFGCSDCQFVASSRSKLTDHTHRKHKGNPVSCDLCGKIFHNQMYMLRHRSSHTGPQHCCDVCGKMFKIQKAMVNHKKTHEAGYKRPVFPCKLCNKTFCSQYIVDCHVKSAHLGQRKSYLCSYCGKKFTTKHSLQEHVNAHSGVKPHVCEICGKGFSYDSALRDHRFTHDALKQFKCNLCHKSFCQRSGLKMHMRIHKESREFQCQECGREFTQKQALQRHERVHNGVKPFTCRMCARSFTDASIIRRHLTLVHKIHKDAKTWREDIICTIQPDQDYHVGLVGVRDRDPKPQLKRSQAERKQAALRVEQNRPLSERSRNICHTQHRETHPTNMTSAVHLPVCLQSVAMVSDAICLSSAGRDHLPSSASQGHEDTVNNASTYSQTPEVHTIQNCALHCSDSPPHLESCQSVQLQELTDVDHEQSPSANSCTLKNAATAAVTSIPRHSDQASTPLNVTGAAAALHTIATVSHKYNTAVQSGCPQTVLPKSNNISDEQLQHLQGSPLTNIQQFHQHVTGGFSMSTSTSCTTTTTSPSTVAALQPWPSLYYYRQLANQFGMNLSDYTYSNTYSSTGPFPGVCLSPTSSSFVDHAAPAHPIHPRSQAPPSGDLAQGHVERDGMDLFGGGQNVGPLPSAGDLELSRSAGDLELSRSAGDLELPRSAGDLELPRSVLLPNGGSGKDVPSGATTVPSPHVNCKQGDNISHPGVM